MMWIRDCDLITVHGFGGDASPFANTTRYAAVPRAWGGSAGHAPFMPSMFRVQRSTRVRLANLVDCGRVTAEGCFDAARLGCPYGPSKMIAAGWGVDPRLWNMVLAQDGGAPHSIHTRRRSAL